MGGADKGELVISVCESSTIGRSSLKVLLVEPESTNTFGELVNRYNVALSRQCDGFDSRTFRKLFHTLNTLSNKVRHIELHRSTGVITQTLHSDYKC